MHWLDRLRLRVRSLLDPGRVERELEPLVQDLRFALRCSRRRPAFTLSVLAVLSFGIGSSTAIFSVVDGVLLKPLPYREPDRLVRVFGAWQHGSREGVSPPDFRDYREGAGVFRSVAAATNTTPLVSLRGAGEPEQIASRGLTASFFATLGIQPLLGREFLPEDEAWKGPRVVVLSHELWQRQFGGEPGVVGEALTMNGYPYTVVGVMPPFFNFLGPAQLFTPIQPNPYQESRGLRTLVMIARLKDGVGVGQAQRELDVISRRLQAEHADFDAGWDARAVPLADEVVRDVKPALSMLLGAVALLVLLVSANVAGLMLSQATRRSVEISLRLSLGASRSRVVRQLLTESLLLALAGGALGCLLASWGVQLVKSLGPAGIPRLGEASVDLRALGFAFLVSGGIGVLVALEPAWRATRTRLGEAMKAGHGGLAARLGIRDLLVLSEVALSIVLLIGAGLLARTLLSLQGVNPGFQPTSVVTLRLALPGGKYAKDGTGIKTNAFWVDSLARVREIPGVVDAAITSELPLSGLDNPTPRLVTTADGVPHHLFLRSVSPAFWRVLRVPMLSGRGFDDDDRRHTPRVVVINEQFRKDVFGDADPIGRRLTFNFRERSESGDYQAVVVGVVGNIRHTSLAAAPFREAYLPVAQSPLLSYDMVVRTRIDPGQVATPLRRAIWSLDPDQGIGPLRTLDDVVDGGLAQPRFRSYLLAAFAGAGLMLAAVGLYGLLSVLVDQSRREIGIRMALGASPQDVLRQVLGRGMALTLAGATLGVLGSLGLSRFLQTLVFGVAPSDPTTFASGALILAATTLVASYVPARRATRLDPAVALRND